MKNDNIQPLAVSIKDAGKMIGVGRTKMYDLIDNRGLRSVKIGRLRMILVEDIHSWLRQQSDAQS